MLLVLQQLLNLFSAGGGANPPVFSGTIPTQEYTTGVLITSLDTASYFSNSPTSYALTGTLPTGLSFDTGTGVLSGTPTVVGTTTGLYVTATNADGSASSNTFSIVVADTATFASGTGRKRDGRRRGWIGVLFGRG